MLPLRTPRARHAAAVMACWCLVACGAADTGASAPRHRTPPGDSVVVVSTHGCGVRVTGTAVGTMVAPGIVLTVAHVAAGATDVSVQHGTDEHDATVVYFDPVHDVALLRTAAFLEPLPLGTAAPGDPAHTVTARDGMPVATPTALVRHVTISTLDVTHTRKITRPAFEIAADIHPGDSGSPVVVDGRVAGIVWARSRLVDGRAWAIDTSGLAAAIESGDVALDQLTDPLDTGTCP